MRVGKALAQVAQRSCGCPIPGSVPGQVGWGLEHPGLVESVPAAGDGSWMLFQILSNPNHSVVLCSVKWKTRVYLLFKVLQWPLEAKNSEVGRFAGL